jgi:thioredoxin-dependent peroxiredoxin
MASTMILGNQVDTIGDLPVIGAPAPSFTLTAHDLSEVTLTPGVRTVLSIFPSVDTGVCAQSVRRFNEAAADLKDTAVVTASADLPFALGRFCGAEGIENVQAGSTFRSSFGEDYGMTMADGPFRGLLARSVVVIDTDGTVLHTEVTAAVGEELDYDAALAALVDH